MIQFDLLIEICDDDIFQITCTHFLPFVSPFVYPITTHIPSLMRQTRNLADQLVAKKELDLLFNLLQCIRPLDPELLFVPDLTARISHLHTNTKNEAMRRFEMAKDIELTSETSEMLTDMLGTSQASARC